MFTRDLEGQPLDADAVRDLRDMYEGMPIFSIARRTFLSMVLGPFTFSIPRLGLVSNDSMQRIIETFWLPWCRDVYDWIKMFGICPWYVRMQGDHPVPVVPGIDLGYISVRVNQQRRDVEFLWTWTLDTRTSFGNVTSGGPKMYWITSQDRPDRNGTICSQLASLLPHYRTILVARNAQNTVVKRLEDPVHVIEHRIGPRSQQDDNLSHFTADFGEAAGIGQQRREAEREMRTRENIHALQQQMHRQSVHNREQSTQQPETWSTTPEQMMHEMDSGFPNRTIVLRPDFYYREAAKPSIGVDYLKLEAQFNLYAAAVMDMALELLTATGTARSQNIMGAERFARDRIKDASRFFSTIIHDALIIAYQKQFLATMEEASSFSMARRRNPEAGHLAANFMDLHPELDVTVEMTSALVTSDDELRKLCSDGFLTAETLGRYLFANHNIPLTDMVVPDEKELREHLRGQKKDKKQKTKE